MRLAGIPRVHPTQDWVGGVSGSAGAPGPGASPLDGDEAAGMPAQATADQSDIEIEGDGGRVLCHRVS